MRFSEPLLDIVDPAAVLKRQEHVLIRLLHCCHVVVHLLDVAWKLMPYHVEKISNGTDNQA